jgi:Sec-independent protein translocase protein TatA
MGAEEKLRGIFMFGLGPTEFLLIAGIAFLLFGPAFVRKFTKNAIATIKESRKVVAELTAAQTDPLSQNEKEHENAKS